MIKRDTYRFLALLLALATALTLGFLPGVETVALAATDYIVTNVNVASFTCICNSAASGDTITVQFNVYSNGNITLNAGVTLIINPGCTLRVQQGHVFTNNGTIINNGTINNYETCGFTNNGTINNDGTINNYETCGFTNNGTISGSQGEPPFISTAALPNGTVGTAYSTALTYTPSLATFTSLSSLPPGLTLSDAGVLSGTPTAVGSFTFKISAENIGGEHIKTFTLTVASPVPRIFVSTGSPSGPVSAPSKPLLPMPKAAFPADATVTGRRINVYALETLRKTLFRLDRDEQLTLLGIANKGRAFFIEHNGRQGYIAFKDIAAEFGAPVNATALRKARAYTLLESGKLQRSGYFDKGKTLWIHGISGKYLVNKQKHATYYLDASQWALAEAP